jgi:hypothetical protein
MADKIFEGLRQFALFLDEQAAEIPARITASAALSSEALKISIKNVYGDQAELAALSATTIALRPDNGSTPLLITGETLRDSIESGYESTGADAISGVGSSEFLVVRHEHGYVTAPTSMIPDKAVPPRPAFAIGVYKALPVIREMVTTLLTRGFRVMTGGGKFASLRNPESMMTGTGDIANRLGE